MSGRLFLVMTRCGRELNTARHCERPAGSVAVFRLKYTFNTLIGPSPIASNYFVRIGSLIGLTYREAVLQATIYYPIIVITHWCGFSHIITGYSERLVNTH